ncbi:MAG: rhomboid family intramembrane serine protease [Leptolyngbya sp. SIOISBB]|nr:rhomboid family intramembrane serine protease [Leptolyngbya sp. SIOISBB]
MPSQYPEPFRRSPYNPAWNLIVIVGLLWSIQIVNVGLFDGRLLLHGIYPRQLDELQGVLWAPFLHGNFGHLLANTLPLITLGGLIMLGKAADFWAVTVISALISGLGTWLIGAPNSVHIGASGVVFGYFGYLLLRGYFERSAFSITASMLVILFYGSFLWGVLPNQPGVSWEGHLFGFLGGCLAARLLSRPPH